MSKEKTTTNTVNISTFGCTQGQSFTKDALRSKVVLLCNKKVHCLDACRLEKSL